MFAKQNWQQFGDSIRAMRTMPLSGLLPSIFLYALTFVLAALAYCFLSFRRLRLRELVVVELAAAAMNRVVPSGLGGLGVHALYLHGRKHTTAQATAVVSINNLLGVLVHLVLLTAVLLMGSAGQFRLGWHYSQGWVLLGFALFFMILLLVRPVRRTLKRFGHNLRGSIRFYKREPHKLFYAAACLFALTLTNLLVLHLVASGFGVSLDLPSLFLVYTAGVFVGAAVPTPGGLAGVEAGLVGGFMAYGVSSTTALAIALAFRLITYWLPLLPGLICLWAARHWRIV